MAVNVKLVRKAPSGLHALDVHLGLARCARLLKRQLDDVFISATDAIRSVDLQSNMTPPMNGNVLFAENPVPVLPQTIVKSHN